MMLPLSIENIEFIKLAVEIQTTLLCLCRSHRYYSKSQNMRSDAPRPLLQNAIVCDRPNKPRRLQMSLCA